MLTHGPADTADVELVLWWLTDDAVTSSRYAALAADLVGDLRGPADGATDAMRGGVGERDAGRTVEPPDGTRPIVDDLGAALTRAAMLLRAVSDDVRGAADLRREAAPRLPRAARPGGDLHAAALAGADLRAAPLRHARLTGADLREADLSWADILGADLTGADVRGARLDRAMFLAPAQLAAARGDVSTRLPARLPRPASWS